MFLSSRLLPVPHGFSLRDGGVSEGAFRSLNLGLVGGDNVEHVRENHRRLAEAGGFELPGLKTVSQVHGDAVMRVDAAPAAEVLRPSGEADALVASRPGAVLGIRTADCVPVLLSDEAGQRVAAVHSGWRGTELRISARAVEALIQEGAQPAGLVVAIGPAIQRCCYEVSDSLALRFRQVFGPAVATLRGGRWHLDLVHAVRNTLLAAGIPPAQIEILPECTACDAKRYFSHRRDKGITGRHLAFIRSRG